MEAHPGREDGTGESQPRPLQKTDSETLSALLHNYNQLSSYNYNKLRNEQLIYTLP